MGEGTNMETLAFQASAGDHTFKLYEREDGLSIRSIRLLTGYPQCAFVTTSPCRQPSTFGNMMNGYCVRANGQDQNWNVEKAEGNFDNAEDCLRWCEMQPSATGCEFIWGPNNPGCYKHASEVVRGNGAAFHYCWVRKITLPPLELGT
eukprot:UN04331